MAKSISLSGTGGAGTDAMTPDPSINEGTMDTGTQGTQDNLGTGGSSMGTDKNKDMGTSTGDKSTNPDTQY